MFATVISQSNPDFIVTALRAFRGRVFLCSAVLIAACAGPTAVNLPELPDWQTRQEILGAKDEWEFSGRIGVSAGEEGFNGRLWWRQDGPVVRARIAGPLGVGTVFLNGHGPELTVTDNDGVVTELRDAEHDLRASYGWTIPVTSLRYWALGIPDPATPAEMTFDDPGVLSQLRQGGWQVDFRDYREAAGQPMPRRLTAASEDVKVRLVIDEWTFRR